MFSLRDVTRRYQAAGDAGATFTLRVPRLDVAAGAKLAFIGESGSGKSTLLELLSMLGKPSATQQFRFRPAGINHDIAALWASGDIDRLTQLRSRHIGYVLQNGGLLPYLTIRANIELSLRLLALPTGDVAQRWADKLDIARQLDKLPDALSIGQRQRAAVARALAHAPRVVIADEPTAAVDPRNAERVMRLLTGLADELGVTLIVASHAHNLMRRLGLTLIEHRIDASDDESMTVTVETPAP